MRAGPFDVRMPFDVRTRVDGDVERLEPGAARDAIAAALESAADLLRPALHYAKRPLTVDVEGDTWHLASDGRSVALLDGAASEGLRLRLTAEQLADLWCDQATPMGWFSSGTLELDGRLEHLLDWWVLLRGAIDQRAPHVAGDDRPQRRRPRAVVHARRPRRGHPPRSSPTQASSTSAASTARTRWPR